MHKLQQNDFFSYPIDIIIRSTWPHQNIADPQVKSKSSALRNNKIENVAKMLVNRHSSSVSITELSRLKNMLESTLIID